MDGHEDDEMMRQCDEVSKEEDKIVKKKRKEMVGRFRVCNGCQG